MDSVELFLAAVDLVTSGDLSRWDELVDPEFVLHPIRADFTGDYVGRRGVEKFLRDNAETFEVFEPHYDEFRILDDGRLFAAGKLRVRGLGSHVDQEVPTAGIATFRAGRAAGWFDYGDRQAALAAAGLSDG